MTMSSAARGNAEPAYTSLPTAEEVEAVALGALERCGVGPALLGGDHKTLSPITGTELPGVHWVGPDDVERAVQGASEAFQNWRITPAPVRGALVRRFSELLAEHKEDLATLISLEVGKITSEALGEVQEMIDICAFAVGLSRQLYGRTMPSERPGHRLMETWHPLGVVGVVSAFNFPAAVWAWNSTVALVCGDPVVWKPSEMTPLTALACDAVLQQAIAEAGASALLSHVLLGDRVVGERLVEHPDVALLSATGSTRMGREVGARVASRFGRCLLELGGNNAAIVSASADLDLATRGIVFAAAGTAGQRCTSMRRLIVHADVAQDLTRRLVAAYEQLPIGNPTAEGALVGPLINQAANDGMVRALSQAEEQGGKVLTGGGRRLSDAAANAFYREPALVQMPGQTEIVRQETFAPILYILTYQELDEAIALNNDVPQGLSSSIFTTDQREAERFVSAVGSDCGIVNVNLGTSGAEIGGAFGGEKETGGGRESGSDSWRAYMRRATNTINYSGELPLAQGVDFTATL